MESIDTWEMNFLPGGRLQMSHGLQLSLQETFKTLTVVNTTRTELMRDRARKQQQWCDRAHTASVIAAVLWCTSTWADVQCLCVCVHALVVCI